MIPLRVLLSLAFIICSATGAAAAEADQFIRGCIAAKDAEWCKISEAQFKREYPDALRGDYQAQRNVAFCLSTGCDGAVQQNKMLGCAWREVIIASGSTKVDSGDIMHVDTCRRQLSPTERTAGEAQARALFQRIYRRPMK